MVNTLEQRLGCTDALREGKEVFVLLDTCAMINLYYQYGSRFLNDETLENGNCYILTSAIRKELEHQYESQATLSEEQCAHYNVPLRSKKVPFPLMNLIWQKLGENKLLEEDAPITEERSYLIQQSMKQGSFSTGNARISSGDISLLSLALELQPAKTVIVSNDSDIPNTLSVLNTAEVYSINEREYSSIQGYQKAA